MRRSGFRIHFLKVELTRPADVGMRERKETKIANSMIFGLTISVKRGSRKTWIRGSFMVLLSSRCLLPVHVVTLNGQVEIFTIGLGERSGLEIQMRDTSAGRQH